MGSAPPDNDISQSAEPVESNMLQRMARGVIARAASWLLDPPLPLVAVVFGLIVLLKTGWNTYVCLDQELMIAKALPGAPTLDFSYQFLRWSLAGPILARLLGAVTPRAFLALHAAVLVLSVVTILAITAYRRGNRAARFVLLALACSSSVTVMLRWLGSYDVFTFLASSLLVLSSGWEEVFVLSGALGFLHFEQGVFIALALLIVGPKRSLGRWRQAGLMLGGLLVGKVLITAYLASTGMDAFSRLYFVTHDEPLSAFVGSAMTYLPALLYTMFGAGWVWLGVLALRVGRDWGQTRRGMLALALLVIPTIVTLDETRVYTMMAWPVLMTLALVAERRAEEDDLRLLAGAGLLGFIVLPAGFVTFEGEFFPALTDSVGRMMTGAVLAAFGVLLVWARSRPRIRRS